MRDQHILIAIGARSPNGPAFRLGGIVIPVINPEPCERPTQIGRGQPVTCKCSRCRKREVQP
jgi:hypothetical protein